MQGVPLVIRLPTRTLAIFLAAALLASPLSCAYEVPVASDSVRDAYFLGQDYERSSHFLDPYTQNLPLPTSGPFLSQVQLLTPYAQVVERSRHNTIDYSAQDAAADYQAAGDTVVVSVRIEFTVTYNYLQALGSVKKVASGEDPNLQLEDFWRDFQFRLWQPAVANPSASQSDVPSSASGKAPATSVIEALDITATPIYVAGGQPLGTLNGATVRFKYDAKGIASAPVWFEVIPPGGQSVVATFDLSNLR
jgi:hypothetical protein